MFSHYTRAAVALAVWALAASPARAGCPSGQYTISLFNDTFETAASTNGNWFLSGTAPSGWWQVGNPDWTWDSGGYKQVGTTPSEQLDPRVFVQGPNALFTGRGGNPADAFDLDGFSRVDSKTIGFRSDRPTYIDLWFFFAHDARATSSDFLKIHFIDHWWGYSSGYGGAVNTLVQEHGNGLNRNGSWIKRTFNMDTFGMRGHSGRFVIEASSATSAVVEAGIEDVNVYYCW